MREEDMGERVKLYCALCALKNILVTAEAD